MRSNCRILRVTGFAKMIGIMVTTAHKPLGWHDLSSTTQAQAHQPKQAFLGNRLPSEKKASG